MAGNVDEKEAILEVLQGVLEAISLLEGFILHMKTVPTEMPKINPTASYIGSM